MGEEMTAGECGREGEGREERRWWCQGREGRRRRHNSARRGGIGRDGGERRGAHGEEAVRGRVGR